MKLIYYTESFPRENTPNLKKKTPWSHRISCRSRSSPATCPQGRQAGRELRLMLNTANCIIPALGRRRSIHLCNWVSSQLIHVLRAATENCVNRTCRNNLLSITLRPRETPIFPPLPNIPIFPSYIPPARSVITGWQRRKTLWRVPNSTLLLWR